MINHATPGSTFRLPTDPEARLLHTIRTLTATSRSELAAILDYSQPTIARYTAKLVERGIITSDFGQSSAAPKQHTVSHHSKRGRPEQTLRMADEPIAAAAAYIGVNSTTITVANFSGHPLATKTIRMVLRRHSPEEALEAIAHETRSLIRKLRPSHPQLLTSIPMGLAFTAPVNSDGTVTSSAYGWHNVAPQRIMTPLLNTHVSVANGVHAMAARELFSRQLPSSTSSSPNDHHASLYFYARDLIGHSWIIGSQVPLPRDNSFNRTLELILPSHHIDQWKKSGLHPLGNRSLIHQAQSAGYSVSGAHELNKSAQRHAELRALLDNRARTLGSLLVIAAETLGPDSIVLAGDVFTRDPRTIEIVRTALSSALPGASDPIRIEQAHPRIMAESAAVVALADLWAQSELLHELL
ncbi:hypothetical protein [Corynebacterium falsenii]|uniref:hypothetical protein n=1 Tax=Corynebacterium falsenii TaxID=108486 RepID=UPI003FD3BEE1